MGTFPETWRKFPEPHSVPSVPKVGSWNKKLDAKCMICGGSSHAKGVCPVKEDTDKFICANCGGNHKSNCWACHSRKRVLEARARQMNSNVRYGNGLFGIPLVEYRTMLIFQLTIA